MKSHYAKAAEVGAPKPPPVKEKSGLEKEKDAFKQSVKSDLRASQHASPGPAKPPADKSYLAEFAVDDGEDLEAALERSEYFKDQASIPRERSEAPALGILGGKSPKASALEKERASLKASLEKPK